MSAQRRIAGCFFIVADDMSYYRPTPKRQYVPQTKLESYTHIVSTTATTTLKQEFFNGSAKPISQLVYEFPIFAGVSVVDFKARFGNNALKGVVRPNEVAKETYEVAKEEGKNAALMQYYSKSGDIFSTKLANIPARSRVVVELTYVENLKPDFGTNGHRFTLPTAIAPRYEHSEVPAELLQALAEPKIRLDAPMKVVVDIETVPGNHIRTVGCPSHNAAVHAGFLSTENIDAIQPSFSKSHVTLTNSELSLGTDFVLVIETSQPDASSAILETFKHNHNLQAIRATVVPTYNCSYVSPRAREIVLLCDRSGSMRGSYGRPGKIDSLKEAAKSLLPSLRTLKNTYFNIVSFGSNFTTLWKESRSLGEEGVYQEARRHVTSKSFDASYGGTDLDRVFTHLFNSRSKDRDLEIILLTDAQYNDVAGLESLIKKGVEESENAIRVFTLGIGNSVSHELIQDLATVSNGFSLATLDNEPLAEKTMAIVNAVDAPHVKSHQVSLKHQDGSITHVTDGHFVSEGATAMGHSFFSDDFVGKNGVCTDIVKPQPSSHSDDGYDYHHSHLRQSPMTDAAQDDTVQDNTTKLETAKFTVPSIIQAPTRLPVLCSSNKMSVYLLLRNVTSPISSIVLSTSLTGGMDTVVTEVPIMALPEPGELVHQLAAKVFAKDLENEGGWLANIGGKHKQNDAVNLFNTEQARIGVHLGVSNKQASFVAVEDAVEKAMTEEEMVDTEMQDFTAEPVSGETLDGEWELVTADNAPSSGTRGGMPSAMLGGYRARGVTTRGATAPDESVPRRSCARGFATRGSLFSLEAPSTTRGGTTRGGFVPEAPVDDVPDAMEVDTKHVRLDDPVEGLLELQDSNDSWAWVAADNKEHIAHYCRLDDYDGAALKVVDVLGAASDDTVLSTLLVLAYLQAKQSGKRLFWKRPAAEAIQWLNTQLVSANIDDVIAQVVRAVY